MRKCKWAGDVADEYCKNCDGIKMMVDGLEKSCDECAGYEPGTEEVDSPVEEVVEETEEIMTPPVEESKPSKETTKSKPKTNKPAKIDNTTKKAETTENATENKVSTSKSEVTKVAEEKHIKEDIISTDNGVQVTALRYTSSATVKKGDNYYKFTAEEEWSTALYSGDVQDVREQLWAKLNSEVDKQIEDLSNM